MHAQAGNQRSLLFSSGVRVAAVLWSIAAALADAQVEELPPLGAAREATQIVVLRAGVLGSDNVSQAGDAKTGQAVALAGAAVNVTHYGTRLDYRLVGNGDWNDYLEGAYRSHFNGAFDGSTGLAIIQDHFYWHVRDSIAQLVVDPFAAATPDNQLTVNYLTTGPRLRFHFSVSTLLSLYGDYARTRSHKRFQGNVDLNSTRRVGGASLTHQLSKDSRISLSADAQRVVFDEQTYNSNYDLEDASLTYEGSARHTDLSATLTYSVLRNQGRSLGLMGGRMQLSRKVSPTSTLSVQIQRRQGDAADLLREDLIVSETQLLPNRIAQPSTVQETELVGRWQYLKGRNTLRTSVLWSENHGDFGDVMDNHVTGGIVDFRRRLRPTLTLLAQGIYTRRSFNSTRFVESLYQGRLGLEIRTGPKASLTLRYEQLRRVTSDGISDFTERRLGLFFNYRLLGPPNYTLYY